MAWWSLGKTCPSCGKELEDDDFYEGAQRTPEALLDQVPASWAEPYFFQCRGCGAGLTARYSYFWPSTVVVLLVYVGVAVPYLYLVFGYGPADIPNTHWTVAVLELSIAAVAVTPMLALLIFLQAFSARKLIKIRTQSAVEE